MGRFMKDEAFERWTESRHAEMGKGSTDHGSNCVLGYRVQKAQGVIKELSSKSTSAIRLTHGL